MKAKRKNDWRDGYERGVHDLSLAVNDALGGNEIRRFNPEFDFARRVCAQVFALVANGNKPPDPVPMLLHCPMCSGRHLDEGEFATRVHHTHACQHCGHCWRPAVVPTVGVQFLPGFKNKP